MWLLSGSVLGVGATDATGVDVEKSLTDADDGGSEFSNWPNAWFELSPEGEAGLLSGVIGSFGFIFFPIFIIVLMFKI